MKALFVVFIFCCFCSLSFSQSTDTIFVESLSLLAKFAGEDNVTVRLKAGNYTIDDTSFSQDLNLTKYRNGEPSGIYPVSALLNFSGDNSKYYFENTTISIAPNMLQAMGNRKLFEVFITGDANCIQGLTVKDFGNGIPTNSAIMMHVLGNNNVIKDADLYIYGSSPYGYGHLLGKARNALVPLHKHSSLLVSGQNTQLLACKVVTHAFGHAIVMQGAVNTYIKDCYVEGKMRTTNDMLAEKEGLAFDLDFSSDYPPGLIVPNEIKALSEDGIRTYPAGAFVATRTKGVTVINTTVKNMRSGFDLAVNLPPTKIVNCTAIGCQEKGYSIGNNGVIEKSKGDAMYGPLLTFIGNQISNCTIDLELTNDVSSYKVSRVAEINGRGHDITIKNYNNQAQLQNVPIVFGKSFWADVHQFRNPNELYSQYAGAKDIKLTNMTALPVILNEYSSQCTVFTNNIHFDYGSDNTVLPFMHFINAGIGGNTTNDLLKRLNQDVIAHDADLVIIMAGTNDMLNSRKLLSYKQYQKNLEQIIDTINAHGGQVLLMSPPTADSTYLYQRHDRTAFSASPNVKLDSVRHIMANLAEVKGVLFFDLQEKFLDKGLPNHNVDLYIRNEMNCGRGDGVHLTPLGYKFVADSLFDFIKVNQDVSKLKKVVCFGDSLTKGVGGSGAGTVHGENYPSFLYSLLINDEL